MRLYRAPAEAATFLTHRRICVLRLRSELIYLLLAAEQVEKREEARSFWHHITTTTPEANDGGCVKPQQPARHAPALEQDALRLSVESSFC